MKGGWCNQSYQVVSCLKYSTVFVSFGFLLSECFDQCPLVHVDKVTTCLLFTSSRYQFFSYILINYAYLSACSPDLSTLPYVLVSSYNLTGL